VATGWVWQQQQQQEQLQQPEAWLRRPVGDCRLGVDTGLRVSEAAMGEITDDV